MNEKLIRELQEKIEASKRLHTIDVALYVTRKFERELRIVKDGAGQFVWKLPAQRNPTDEDGPPEVFGVPVYPILDNSLEEKPFRVVVEL